MRPYDARKPEYLRSRHSHGRDIEVVHAGSHIAFYDRQSGAALFEIKRSQFNAIVRWYMKNQTYIPPKKS